MRSLSWIPAAFLAASAAHAQVASDCRGETLSSLAECATPAPPASEATEGVTEVSPGSGGRISLGGSLRPTNLRAAPPVSTLPSRPIGQAPGTAPRTEADLPQTRMRDPLSSLDEMNRNLDRSLRPLTGFATDYQRNLPGARQSR